MRSEKLVLKLPGDNGKMQQVVAPSGIPKELSGGLDTSGKALIQTGYQYLFLLAIFLAVLFTIYSGMQMITSGGDSQKLASARKRLMFSILGLAIVILAFLIAGAIIRAAGGDPKLFFK